MESTDAVVDGSLPARLRASQLPPPAARRAIRLASGASQRAVAAELHVSPMTVGRWESGEMEPRLDHAIAYRALLDALRDVTRGAVAA